MSDDRPLPPPEPAPGAPPGPAATTATAVIPPRPRNGLGVAALVIGVASLVAVFSFVLFPVGLIASILGVVLGIVALSRSGSRGATNQGQAVAGVICSGLALVLAIGLTVRVGTWAARNTGVFARFDKCIAKANDRVEVSNCIARFARDVRP